MNINPIAMTWFAIYIVSIAGVIISSIHKPDLDVVNSVSLALMTSCIFYLATVIIPEGQRRKRLRNRLLKQYRAFKLSCIRLFLIASESQEYKEPAQLLDHKKFRSYFSAIIKDTQRRWDLVATHVDEGDCIFNDLVDEWEFLLQEINFTRANVDIHDDTTDDFIKNMIQVIHRLKATKSGTDNCDYFCRNLWIIFTRWNSISGQMEDDVFETMISKI